MNDEIKATLQWLKECGENDYIFETGNSKMLLDYITNLQQENEKLKEENNRLYDLCESNNISYLKGIEDAKQLNDYKYDGFVEKWLKEMKEKLQRGD